MNTDDLYCKLEQETIFLDKVKEYSTTAVWTWVPFMNLSTDFQKILGIELINQDSLYISCK